MKTKNRLRVLLSLALSLSGAFAWSQEAWVQPLQQAQLQSVQTGTSVLNRSVLFLDYVERNPDAVWSEALSPEVRQSIQDYKDGKSLPSGQVYGASVKTLDPRGKTAAEIDEELLRRGFEKYADAVRDPKTKQPKLDGAGRQIIMLVYVHADGGMVRVKPDGESTNRFRPQPHLSKSVRYPHDADYRDFAQEAFKVDPVGRPLPKTPGDLKNPYDGTPLKNTFMDGWADTVHTDVKAAMPAMALP